MPLGQTRSAVDVLLVLAAVAFHFGGAAESAFFLGGEFAFGGEGVFNALVFGVFLAGVEEEIDAAEDAVAVLVEAGAIGVEAVRGLDFRHQAGFELFADDGDGGELALGIGEDIGWGAGAGDFAVGDEDVVGRLGFDEEGGGLLGGGEVGWGEGATEFFAGDEVPLRGVGVADGFGLVRVAEAVERGGAPADVVAALEPLDAAGEPVDVGDPAPALCVLEPVAVVAGGPFGGSGAVPGPAVVGVNPLAQAEGSPVGLGGLVRAEDEFFIRVGRPLAVGGEGVDDGIEVGERALDEFGHGEQADEARGEEAGEHGSGTAGGGSRAGVGGFGGGFVEAGEKVGELARRGGFLAGAGGTDEDGAFREAEFGGDDIAIELGAGGDFDFVLSLDVALELAADDDGGLGLDVGFDHGGFADDEGALGDDFSFEASVQFKAGGEAEGAFEFDVFGDQGGTGGFG